MIATLAKQKCQFLDFLNPGIYLISVLPAVAIFSAINVLFADRLFLSMLLLVFLQHGVNLLNDYEDDRRGADINKHDSWIHYYQSPYKLKLVGMSYFVGSCIFGSILLVYWGLWPVLIWSLPFVLLAYAYNKSKNPVSYSVYAEWVTACCYGPGVVFAMSYIANPHFNETTIFLSFGFAALAAAVLISHQIPQISDDFRVNKKTFALRYGSVFSLKIVNALLLLFACSLFYTLLGYLSFLILLLMIPVFLKSFEFMRLNPALILKVAALLILLNGFFIKILETKRGYF